MAGLESIYSFLQLTPSLATAGQPTEGEFAAVKAFGYWAANSVLPPPCFLSVQAVVVFFLNAQLLLANLLLITIQSTTIQLGGWIGFVQTRQRL